MVKLEMLYEGKAKKVFKTSDPELYMIEYKDDATAFNGAKKGQISGKGAINNKMTALIFEKLASLGIPTHFIKRLSDREQLVKAVQILPLEVIVRNTIAGSMAKRLGIAEGTEPKKVIQEFCYKNDKLGDPLINDDHAIAIGLASAEQIAIIKRYTAAINDFLLEFFYEKELKLVDFKLEFGIYQGEVILADEISPDTCRLWDLSTGKKMDKDRFRRDLGEIEQTYQEVWRRLEE